MRRCGFLLPVMMLLGCSNPPELTRHEAAALIQSAEAWRAPIDPGIAFIDTRFRPGPTTKREILRLEGIAMKQDGPFGVAGKTATVRFSWRWTEGPMAGRRLISKARLHGSKEGWTVYEDYLKHDLWRAERNEGEQE